MGAMMSDKPITEGKIKSLEKLGTPPPKPLTPPPAPRLQPDQSERIKGTGNKHTVPSLRRTVDEDGNKIVIMSEQSYEMMSDCLEAFSEQPDQSEVIRDLAGVLEVAQSCIPYNGKINSMALDTIEKALKKHAQSIKQAHICDENCGGAINIRHCPVAIEENE